MARKFIVRHKDSEMWLTMYGFKAGGQARGMALQFDTNADAQRHIDDLPAPMKAAHIIEPYNVEDNPTAPGGYVAHTEYDPFGYARYRDE